MEDIRNVTATGAPRCRGRACGEAVREAGKPIYYRPEQCKRACEAGSNLCKICLTHEANVVAGGKGLKWHGRVGNTIPNVSHIEGSKWYRTKVLGAVDDAAAAAAAAEKAAAAAAKAEAKEEAKAARLAATAAKAAEREAAAAAKEAAKAEKAAATEAAKLAREAEKAAAMIARAEREAAKEKKVIKAAESDETAAHRAAAALFARVNRNRNALYRTAAAASRKAATEARKANAAAKRATTKAGRKATTPKRKTSSNRARNNRGRFTARRNNSRAASASPARVARTTGYATPYSATPRVSSPAMPAPAPAPAPAPRSSSTASFNEAAAMQNLMGNLGNLALE